MRNPVNIPPGKTRKYCGGSTAPEDGRSRPAEAEHHNVLGEALEAVKPCLEEYAQDQNTSVASTWSWRV